MHLVQNEVAAKAELVDVTRLANLIQRAEFLICLADFAFLLVARGLRGLIVNVFDEKAFVDVFAVVAGLNFGFLISILWCVF